MRKPICVTVLIFMFSGSAMAGQTPRNLRAASVASTVADSLVTLDDAWSFDTSLASEIDRREISAARQEMSSAVSAEKFLGGAAAVVAAAFFLAIVF